MSLSALVADAPLKQGASGDVVRAVQLALRALGYPLLGSGYFGPATDTAVEDFQKRQGLPVTGIVDAGTSAAIEARLKLPAPSPPAEATPLWLSVSLANVGLAEAPGAADNAELIADIRTAAPDYQHDATPWCGGWAAFCLLKAGIKPPRTPLWALAYADGWGVRLAGAALGAVAVKRRNGGGHVTFVAGKTRGGMLACCGGNQNDRVNVAPYAPGAFLGFFWPRELPPPTRTGLAHLPIVDARGAVVREA